MTRGHQHGTGVARRRAALAIVAALAMLGCDREPERPSVVQPEITAAAIVAPPAAVAAGACAGNDARLPVTGLCEAAAAALLLRAGGSPATPPDGCSWAVAEAAIADGSMLLYRGAQCGSRTARLRFAADAVPAGFVLAVSPFEGAPDEAEPVVRMVRGADAAGLLKVARGSVADPAERARCRVRPADMEDWPADALVVDEVPAPEADGIRSACGPLGYDGGAQSFWRVSQNTGWFFTLGQDSPPIDAGSVTLVRRTATGTWQRA